MLSTPRQFAYKPEPMRAYDHPGNEKTYQGRNLELVEQKKTAADAPKMTTSDFRKSVSIAH